MTSKADDRDVEELDIMGSDLPMDPKLCRLCLMAAIVFAFGKEAALLI